MKKLIRGLSLFLVLVFTFTFIPTYSKASASMSDRMWIESPGEGVNISENTIDIYGWVLSNSGAEEANFYLNGKLVGSSKVNIERLDVESAYPGYINGKNSGFSYELPLDNALKGNNKITVEVVSKDGSKQKQERNIKVAKKDSIMWVEAPANYSNASKNGVDVYGWALNPSGIKEIKILLNDKFIESTTASIERLDVDSIYPGYVGGKNSGFKYNLSLKDSKDGVNKITVQAVGNNGEVKSEDRFVNVKRLPSKMWIEGPASGVELTENTSIYGWALNDSGIKEVRVYSDGVLIDKAKHGLPREDVNKVFPGYVEGAKSGFSYELDPGKFSLGNHRVTIEVEGNNGEKQSMSIEIKVKRKPLRANVETVYENMNLDSNSLKIAGWALTDTSIKDIKIYVDNTYVGDAIKDILRDDVKEAYPGYKNGEYPGFEYLLDTSRLPIGEHAIKVVITDEVGETLEKVIKVLMGGQVTYKEYPKSLDFYADIQLRPGAAPIISDPSSPSRWRTPTLEEVKYYMNPDNFINDPVGKYMFLKLNYTEGITAEHINILLKGKGVLEGKGEVFVEAGRRANVNPIYLVSHSLLETGNGTSKLARGTIVNKLHRKEYTTDENGNKVAIKVFEKDVPARLVYNVFGIGAFDDDANFWGADRAYREGWVTVDDAIIGGAKWIAKNYISIGQDTLYKMKWDFDTTTMWHQYATDVAWAQKQTIRIKNLISQLRNPVLQFEVPKFK
ncbi:Ig-like domain-containing protein [Clostridium sp.]|uniref:Ig-like domain-containing protein n=1 Tax=Clostridium sp. TaxID=1506 RepID=UPI003463E49B